jgi:general secretion pathway protein N
MTEAASLQVQVGLSSLQVQASDGSTQWPAALLTGLGSPWNTVQPDGQLRLRTEALKLSWTPGRLQMKGLADLQVQSLSSRLSPIKPIGSYQLQLRGSAEGTATPSLQLNTLKGPLHLTGQSQWVGSRLRFTGEASAQEGHEAGLTNLLNILGHRQGARSHFSFGAKP